MNAQQQSALLQVIRAVHEAVSSCQDGVPAGTVCAALMAQGCSIQQYGQIEGMMIRAGAIVKKGNLLFSMAKK